MSTNYSPAERAELSAPLPVTPSRYTCADTLRAAILAAADGAPEVRPEIEHPGRYVRAPIEGEAIESAFQRLERAGWRNPECSDGPASGWPRALTAETMAGPLLPAPADARVSFAYSVGGVRGTWSTANTRPALLALADKVHRARVAFAGKVPKPRRPAAPSASAPHVTARAMVTGDASARDYAGALQIAEQSRGGAFIGANGAAGVLYMQAEHCERAGHGFTVARSVASGRFRVNHTGSGFLVDSIAAGAPRADGFTTQAAALSWLDSSAAEEPWRAKLEAAAAKCAPHCQAAARVAWLAQDPAGAASGADAGAEDAEHPAAADRPAMDPETALAAVLGANEQRAAERAAFHAAPAGFVGPLVTPDESEARHGAAVSAVISAAAQRGETVREVSAEEWDSTAAALQAGESARVAAAELAPDAGAVRAAADALARISADWAPDADRARAIAAGRAGDSTHRAALAMMLGRAAERGRPVERSEARAALADLLAGTRTGQSQEQEETAPPTGQSRTATPSGQSGPRPAHGCTGPVFRAQLRTYHAACALQGMRRDSAPIVADDAPLWFIRGPGIVRAGASRELRGRVAHAMRDERRSERKARELAAWCERERTGYRARMERAAEIERGAELAECGGSVRFTHPDGREALAGPDMSGGAVARLTRFDANGPSGHTGFGALREAIEHALSEGFAPMPPATHSETPTGQSAEQTEAAAVRIEVPEVSGDRHETAPAGFRFLSAYCGPRFAGLSLIAARIEARKRAKANPAERFTVGPFERINPTDARGRFEVRRYASAAGLVALAERIEAPSAQRDERSNETRAELAGELRAEAAALVSAPAPQPVEAIPGLEVTEFETEDTEPAPLMDLPEPTPDQAFPETPPGQSAWDVRHGITVAMRQENAAKLARIEAQNEATRRAAARWNESRPLPRIPASDLRSRIPARFQPVYALR